MGYVFASINILLWLTIFFIQQTKNIEKSDSLHMQDFWTNGIVGDLIALSILDFCIGATIFGNQLRLLFVLISLIVASFSVMAFYLYFSQPKRKLLDWGWCKNESLKWVSTFGGKVHMCYFFIQTFWISMFVLNLAIYKFPPLILSLAIIGASIYMVAFILDQKKFRSLF